jgi:hypothetical protein
MLLIRPLRVFVALDSWDHGIGTGVIGAAGKPA